MWIRIHFATLSLHWVTIEQQLDAQGDREMLEAAQTIRNRAADFMKQKAASTEPDAISLS